MSSSDLPAETIQELGNGLVYETWKEGQVTAYYFDNSTRAIMDTWSAFIHQNIQNKGLPDTMYTMYHFKTPGITPYLRQRTSDMTQAYQFKGYIGIVVERTPFFALIKAVAKQLMRYRNSTLIIEIFPTRQAALTWLFERFEGNNIP